ncbi:hypothetical protein THIOM_002983 [Candidatus Thiomargarita nelsonii]|uniref:Uncharacterized protein n=1 Tax=Candidatus Thiomargarita nelsonii TaxID=1003181 RepID=A0A176RZW2_9GAMM|nr:hypothetical protein THIOM_002983 [Candidatus Thiomargarita nelsonii]
MNLMNCYTIQICFRHNFFWWRRAGVGTHSRRASVAAYVINTGRWRVQTAFPRRRVGTRK